MERTMCFKSPFVPSTLWRAGRDPSGKQTVYTAIPSARAPSVAPAPPRLPR